MYGSLFITSLPKALGNKENLDYFKGNSSCTRDDIIVGNMRLVAAIVNKYNVSEEDKKDLFQIGLIGLMKAVDTFDYKKGIQFSSYAGTCISNEIGMHLRKRNKDCLLTNIDEPLYYNNNGDEIRLGDILIDEKASLEEDYEDKETINLLKELVVSLNVRDSFIVSLYFGLFDNEALSSADIAFRLNISRTHVSRLVKKILLTLKELILNPPKKRKRRGKRGTSIFKLLKEYDRKLIIEVINELNEEDKILLYLRCGRYLDNPRPSPLWNEFTAYKFNTRLMPKIKRKLDEKIWLRDNKAEKEELSPMKEYRKEKINELHNLLMNMDMINAQIALHEYLNDTGFIQYEKFIVSLIILSVMDKDFTFTSPIRILVLLEKGYQFNGEKYRDYFYEALMQDTDEAPLYLDIITCLQKNGLISFDVKPLQKAYERVLNK